MKQKIKLITFILFFPVLIFAGLYWIAFGVAIIVGICLLYYSRLKLFVCLRKNRILNPLAVIVFILLISISARVFFIEIFAIPSASMEDTLKEGDKVLVSKLNYGPVLPRNPFEIPWINLIWYLKSHAGTKTDSAYWDFKRLKGYSKIRHNDIVVFLHPLWGKKDNFFIKRCTGLPGNTLQIINSRVYINGEVLPEPNLVKQKYSLKINNQELFNKELASLSIENSKFHQNNNKGSLKLLFTNLQRKKIENLNSVDSINNVITSNDSINWVTPKTREFLWTIDNYGPVIIPRKGMTIELTHRNLMIYQRTLDMLEKQKIRERNGLFYLNGAQISVYTFKQSYYFMMGDNRSDSNDSRYWGFVPEENIMGKAILVLFSNDDEGFRMKRVFRVIR